MPASTFYVPALHIPFGYTDLTTIPPGFVANAFGSTVVEPADDIGQLWPRGNPS